MRPKKKLGEILVDSGVLSASQVEQVLREQARLLLPFASATLRLGLAPEASLALALAEQYGTPGVDLSASALDPTALALVPAEVARQNLVLPLGFRGAALELAMANPARRAVLDEIAFATGREVLVYVAVRARLEETIQDAYRRARDAPGLDAGLSLLRPASSAEAPRLPEAELFAIEEVVEPPRLPPKQPNRPRALVVDDELAILDIIDRALSHRGLEVVRAMRGREALELFKTADPDIVLLDAMLPEVHGFELCSIIKRSEALRHVPVMMISAIYTGWTFGQDIKRLYGADEFLEKPFRIAELLLRVEGLLARTRGETEPRAPSRVGPSLRAAAEALRSGRAAEALQLAERAVSLEPLNARAQLVLASALEASGDVYRAISVYERALSLEPALFAAAKSLAVLYERQGFRAKAVEMWMRAVENSENDAVRQAIRSHLIGLL